MTNQRFASAPLTQHDVEAALLDLSERLADATDEHRDLCDAAAQAEMDYKHAYHTAVIALASGAKTTADVRAATAWLRSENQQRAHMTLSAAKEASREHLRTLTTRIEALRTIAANVRHQS